VNYEKNNFTQANIYCHTVFNASLAAFSDVTMYFRIINDLHLRKDAFWVDG